MFIPLTFLGRALYGFHQKLYSLLYCSGALSQKVKQSLGYGSIFVHNEWLENQMKVLRFIIAILNLIHLWGPNRQWTQKVEILHMITVEEICLVGLIWKSWLWCDRMNKINVKIIRIYKKRGYCVPSWESQTNLTFVWRLDIIWDRRS